MSETRCEALADLILEMRYAGELRDTADALCTVCSGQSMSKVNHYAEALYLMARELRARARNEKYPDEHSRPGGP